MHKLTVSAGVLACLGLAVVVVACQAQPLAGAGTGTGVGVGAGNSLAIEATLLQRIEAEIGTAACTGTDECRSLAIGAKACGGPTRWLAWSTSASNAAQLQAWAAELAQRQRRREQALGMVSTCSVVPDPGASCEAGRCVAGRPDLAR